MQYIKHFYWTSFLVLSLSINCLAQSEISLKSIKEYAEKNKPKIGIVVSYDSIFLEVTVNELIAKDGLKEAMVTGLVTQTEASRMAYARYEAMTAPAISKMSNFDNIAFVLHDDALARGGFKTWPAKAEAIMKKEGVKIIVNVVFGGKFMKGLAEPNSPNKQVAMFMHGEIKYRFFVNSTSIQYNYPKASVFSMSYQFGADETHKDWSTDKVQAYMAKENLGRYAEKLDDIRQMPLDEVFLDNRTASHKAIVKYPTSVEDSYGISWPLESYAGNSMVVPSTSIKEDPTGFALDKVRSLADAIKTLESKGFKIGIIFSPYSSATNGKGIIRYFSDSEVDKFIKDAENILHASTGADNNAKLKELGLVEKTLQPVEGEYLNAGNALVKTLNERYQSNVFELVDPKQLPKGQSKLVNKSKLLSAMSKLSGDAMDIFDLSKSQYKLLGNLVLNIDQNNKKIESDFKLYETGAAGLVEVGAGFNMTQSKVTIAFDGSAPDAIYNKYIGELKSAVEFKADGMWEGKAKSAFTFSYKDKAMLHPPTNVNTNAKPNIVPKKEKSLLEKVRRYEAEGHKIGIILDPTAIVAEKEKPQTSMVSSTMPIDTVDCVFSSGRIPFSDQYLYLGQKLQQKFNEAFETKVFEVIDPDVMPTKMGLKLGSVVQEEVPAGFDTQYKILVTLSIAGTYNIKKAGTSNISISKAGSSGEADSKEGKYEMNMSILSMFRAEEFNNENNKDKNVARNSFQFTSDRFLTNDCPTGIDDFVSVVGAPEDLFPSFEAMLDDNMDKVIKKEMK